MSGSIDEDTARTVARGRDAVGSVLSTAQSNLKKVFLIFVVGFLAAFWSMGFVWGQLKADLIDALNLPPGGDAEVVAVTPFDVILLQVKIGLVFGIVCTIPALVWYGRGSLKARGAWPSDRIPRWKLAGLGALVVVLFFVGLVYAYELFFPLMFNFLATNAIKSGFAPTYSITKWTQFIAFLALSFGLAAQLPLGMSSAASTGIVKYETFRDKWRYAVLGIFAFGAVFSPPDPFTQIMWAVPLVVLYWFSLGVTKLVVLAQRAGENVPLRRVVRDRWNVLAGTFVLAAAVGYTAIRQGAFDAANWFLELIKSSYRAPDAESLSLFGLDPQASAVLIGLVLAVIATAVALFYVRIKALEQVQVRGPDAVAAGAGDAAAAAAAGDVDPADIDLEPLDAAGIRAAPPQVFSEMTEPEALQHAERAMEADDPEKAQAILDRFDQEEAVDDVQSPEEVNAEQADGTAETDDEGNVVTSTAAGMMDAFTEDETTEDDVGGYFYDIRFIVDSLTSKAMWLVAVFMLVLAGTFVALYSGGIRVLKNAFLSGMPESLRSQVEIVTLHPVEALIFEVKFSTLMAALAVLPLILYWAWPAMKERGFAGGDRRILIVWGGTLLVALVGGSVVGFLWIAPTIISFLAQDAITSHMVIAYRINNFGWLVFFLTAGIGILTEIPVTMYLFHRGGLVSFETMWKYWRVVVLGMFLVAGIVSPRGVFTMLLLALPASFAFGVGLAILWLLTWPRRRRERKQPTVE